MTELIFRPYYAAQVPYLDTSLLIMVAGLHVELLSFFGISSVGLL
jgi:hypothetical protein